MMHSFQTHKSQSALNCILGGMDLAANGMNVHTFLRGDCPFLVRVLLSGCVREVRNAFLSHIMVTVCPAHILEIGGGRGGDASILACASDVEIVDVVEPDATSVQEYKRRIMDRFQGMEYNNVMVLPDARRFRFHAIPLFDLSPSVAQKGCDLAFLYFSITQIAANDTDVDALLAGLFISRGIPHVVIGVHDHTTLELPNDEAHVTCRVIRSSGCSEHPLVCTCPRGNGQTARLHTTIVASATARSIEENAFSVDHFMSRVDAFQRRWPSCPLRCEVWWPYRCNGDAHWLLQTMAFLHLTQSP
jgi:hypothetical protein